FERMARQVVALETALDGRPIPVGEESWAPTPEKAIAAVETHPAIAPALADPDWPMWRDVLCGVVLDAAA
ncbi:MAG: hypothetical protein HC897_15880, partial [Thermoanaerobaculia bacterium]|nr:hypothetical protein [Thermoanaerobaculia bacterium]